MQSFISLGFDRISERHARGMRILLLIDGIEPNPGPIDTSTLISHSLENILQLIHEDEDDYELPRTNRKIIEAIGK